MGRLQNSNKHSLIMLQSSMSFSKDLVFPQSSANHTLRTLVTPATPYESSASGSSTSSNINLQAGMPTHGSSASPNWTANPLVKYRWFLFNCDEMWMRYIQPGMQTIRWKSFCWFLLRGVLEERQSFVEIFPCAGRQAVLKVNGLAIREPQRLYVGDIITVMDELRWEVRLD